MKDNYSHIDDKIFYTVTNISSNDDQENLAVACQCVNDCTISKECQCLLISGGINYDVLSRFSQKKAKTHFQLICNYPIFDLDP